MTEIKGLHNTAIVYATTLEDGAAKQIQTLCDFAPFSDSKIRIMPDVHAGMGCTIGTTMTIKDKVVPGMVGVDIGCGMETVQLAEKEIDFALLDRVIHNNIPSGRDIRSLPHKNSEEIDLTALKCAEKVNLNRAYRSIGTLGGGNHFIEVDKDDEGNLYLVVHSGSRHIGNQVARYYQQQAAWQIMGASDYDISAIVEKMKSEGNLQEIKAVTKQIKQKRKENLPFHKDLAYVTGQLFEDYIHDMKLIQHFATLNRKTMVDIILEKTGLTAVDSFTTIHNYIDTENMILRKGAVSARKGQKLLIPINMRDGALICTGKGNPECNCSAPHGAGRLMSRRKAFDILSMEQYKKEMEGIYTTSVNSDTLDESPMAYKPIDEILFNITPTAEIYKIIKPVYNFKASE